MTDDNKKDEHKDESAQSDEKKSDAPQQEEKIASKDKKAEEKTANASDDAKKMNDENEEIEVPEKFKSFVEQIEQMSVLDLSELVKILEKKFGVSAAAPVAIAATPGAAQGDEAEEKTSFTVELASIGDNKIGVIKAVREITQKGLKDAKDIVDSAPSVIAEDVKKEEAEEMKKKIEEAGGQANLK